MTLLSTARQHRLEDGEASEDADRVHILNSLARQPDLNAAPLAQHDAYDEINAALQWFLGLAQYVLARGARSEVHVELPVVDAGGCRVVRRPWAGRAALRPAAMCAQRLGWHGRGSWAGRAALRPAGSAALGPGPDVWATPARGGIP